MKSISLNVSDPIYEIFEAESARRDRTTSDLIREAMEEYVRVRVSNRTSMSDLKPASLGKPLATIDWSEDFFEEVIP